MVGILQEKWYPHLGWIIYETLIFFDEHGRTKDTTFRHAYHTRAKQCVFPSHKSEQFEKSQYYMAIRLYSQLPEEVKQTRNTKRYKSSLKKYLLEVEPYGFQDFLCRN
ncbi:hypothetical protein WA026_005286 [Henosepilachna vigintioctopunctata]|uniref:Uncharacterized protein n=1 Tax=Henosepilachna vigintioctopunctata TaxID=420089 RepID=A0AAW1UL70_9CUCU